MNALRQAFYANSRSGQVDAETFYCILSSGRASVLKGEARAWTRDDVQQLFNHVDIDGSGFVTWDAFTSFAIDSVSDSKSRWAQAARKQASPHHPKRSTAASEGTAESGRGGGAVGTGEAWASDLAECTFRPYQVHRTFPQSPRRDLLDVRVLPSARKIVKVERGERMTSRMQVLHHNDAWSLYAEVPLRNDRLIAWEYIPSTVGISHSDHIACSFAGSTVGFYRLRKGNTTKPLLRESKTMALAEMQTVLRWSPKYHRLVLGSKSGVVSVLNVDSQLLFAQERLHREAITDMCILDRSLFTASTDSVSSIKCVDVERCVVRFNMGDHLGGILLLATEGSTLFSAGFANNIQRHFLAIPNSTPAVLIDHVQPHRGRLTRMCLMEGTMQLLTGDITGMIKIWDLRMNSCVQTLSVNASNDPSDDPDDPDDRQNVPRQRSVLPPIRGAMATHSSLAGCHPLTNSAATLKVFTGTQQSQHSIVAMGQIPGSEHFFAANSRGASIYTLHGSSLSACVDDTEPCRFIFFPRSDQALTVHESIVRLWDLPSGTLLYRKKQLLPAELTAACLVQPLDRQFILASSLSHVAVFSVALCLKTRDLSQVVCQARGAKDTVVSLQYAGLMAGRVSQSRSEAMIFVVFPRNVLALPDVDHCPARLVQPLRAVENMIPKSAHIVQSQVVCNSDPPILLLAASHGGLFIVDVVTLSPLHVFGPPEEPFAQETTFLAVTPPLLSTPSPSLLLTSDGVGRLVVTEMLPHIGRWNILNMWQQRCTPGHEWGASGCADCSLISTSAGLVPPYSAAAEARGVNVAAAAAAAAETQLLSPSGGSSEVADGSSSRPSVFQTMPVFGEVISSESSSCIVATATGSEGAPPQLLPLGEFMYAVMKHHLLVTASEKGRVVVWDADSLMGCQTSPPLTTDHKYPGDAYEDDERVEADRQLPSTSSRASLGSTGYPADTRGMRRKSKPLGGYLGTLFDGHLAGSPPAVAAPSSLPTPPVEICAWQAHQGIISISVTDHGELGLPVLFTSTFHREVFLWSLDGVLLGSLSTGREFGTGRPGASETGLPAHSYSTATPALWRRTMSYLATHPRTKYVTAMEQRRGGRNHYSSGSLSTHSTAEDTSEGTFNAPSDFPFPRLLRVKQSVRSSKLRSQPSRRTDASVELEGGTAASAAARGQVTFLTEARSCSAMKRHDPNLVARTLTDCALKGSDGHSLNRLTAVVADAGSPVSPLRGRSRGSMASDLHSVFLEECESDGSSTMTDSDGSESTPAGMESGVKGKVPARLQGVVKSGFVTTPMRGKRTTVRCATHLPQILRGATMDPRQ